MEHVAKLNIIGHLKITDKDSGEILVDQDNAIHYGNISTQIAGALTGLHTAFIEYMAFGDDGTTTDMSGNVTLRLPNVSIEKNTLVGLYQTNLVVKLTNNRGLLTGLNDGAVRVLDSPSNQTNFEDIAITAELTTSDTIADGKVFDEIGLFSGPTAPGQPNIHTSLPTNPGPVMITHIIFHPIQKTANRTLSITYTLRVQMGD